MTRRKLISNVNKMDLFVKTNLEDIKQIIVTEEFMKSLEPIEDQLDLKVWEDEDNVEHWMLFGAPVMMSRFIVGNKCVLEMKDGQFVVLAS